MSSRSFFVRFSAFNAFLFLGTGIQMPFLPLWLRSEGLSDSQISLIVAAMVAIRIFAMPLGTYLVFQVWLRASMPRGMLPLPF